MLFGFKSVIYVLLTIAGMISVKLFMPHLLSKLRKFEQDCEMWDASSRSTTKVLPEKECATDDSSTDAERSDRLLMDILYELPKDSIKKISPDSLYLKTLVKVPMLIFVNLAAMASSLSEMFMKIIGCIIKDAQSNYDYLYVIPFALLLAYTGYRTFIYVNYGIKYYDQMEVMPVYQTCLLNHNILVGMLCLDELRFYSGYTLLGIMFSTTCCIIGITVLLEKNKEKRKAVISTEEGGGGVNVHGELEMDDLSH